jgi:DnaK suppressor protein
MNMEELKNKLEEEKKFLESELQSIATVDKTGDWETKMDSDINIQEVQDEADMADRSEEYEERSSLLKSLEKRFADVNKALSKIENKTFGSCEVCGKEIEEDRLAVHPSATTCKVCMNKI